MSDWIKIGIGGPVGSGKSHLLLRICETLRDKYSMVVITNDIYTREDAQFLTNQKALEQGRIMGVETGGCPHAAIRDDISLNNDALMMMKKKFPDAKLAFIESGGDNLSATFSPDLVDYQIYIIDVAQGGDIPRKGGIGIARSDLLVVNKIDLAPYVEVDLAQMESDILAARGPLGFVMTNLKINTGVNVVCHWIESLLGDNMIEKEAFWAGKPTLQSSTLHHHHHDHDHEH
ncbi:MAG: urease accessory protein UreG [Spirochaetales bacterium]|nr:urease accessory protein UreG [Spirochaetales bacterium]